MRNTDTRHGTLLHSVRHATTKCTIEIRANCPRRGRSYLKGQDEYRTGYPDKPGWYDVRVDGREDRLLFRYCHTCNIWEWKDINGVRVTGQVEYIPESFAIYP